MSDWSALHSVAERVAQLRQEIPDRTRIIAVTKTVPTHLMREAYAAGLRDFGESRIQEAAQKQQELADLTDVTWHFIGHLQQNKVKQALLQFQWIHSVDSLALAQRLNLLAADLKSPPKICLQVKLRDDPQKFGWNGKELLKDLAALYDCHRLEFKGLMTILPIDLSPSEQRVVFEETAAIAQHIRAHAITPLPLTELSMGMSDDYPLAIQAGSTMVRLGRIIFGERNNFFSQ
ncbi:MAG: YggS family pyridoxal phosphate-dependent enzyme [Acaryochloridaceae cyanobacterium RU_4_10]|nr:YggS family pyridoxal phosphate-dependent enzyme [Acaryochloridaceae cyanobacterium RU_4_10]